MAYPIFNGMFWQPVGSKYFRWYEKRSEHLYTDTSDSGPTAFTWWSYDKIR